jgi:hypothetical protein
MANMMWLFVVIHRVQNKKVGKTLVLNPGQQMVGFRI